MPDSKEAIAKTAAGAWRGEWRDGVATFRGVRYAAPPVGARRFAPPQPVEPWSGTRDALTDGPIPPQSPSRLGLVMGEFSAEQGEDCLSLSIWTPAPDFARRPVIVWLHGGAFISGAGSLPWYGGQVLARDGDVVVVGVNYRLGMLGFLRHQGVSTGTEGLLDQEAALAWVRDNIAAFGGDPDQVTVMGQSAGAGSILSMLGRPSGRDLFRRAIVESGAFRDDFFTRETADNAGRRFIELLGLDPDDRAVGDKLRDVPVAKVLEAQGALARESARVGRTALPFRPAPDHATAREFANAAAAGAAGREVLIGTTREEMAAWYSIDPRMTGIDAAAAAEQALQMTGEPEAWDLYRAARPAGTPGDVLCDVATDQSFRFGSLRFAADLARRGSRVYAYQFDWAPPASPHKACHCIELPFVFGTLADWPAAPMLAGGDPAGMAALSETIRRYWIAFARTGEPAVAGAPPWPPYEAARRMTMRLDALCGAVGDLAGIGWRTSRAA